MRSYHTVKGQGVICGVSGLGFDLEDLGFASIRGTVLGIPVIRILACGGLHWGLRFHRNSHIQSLGTLKFQALGVSGISSLANRI